MGEDRDFDKIAEMLNVARGRKFRSIDDYNAAFQDLWFLVDAFRSTHDFAKLAAAQNEPPQVVAPRFEDLGLRYAMVYPQLSHLVPPARKARGVNGPVITIGPVSRITTIEALVALMWEITKLSVDYSVALQEDALGVRYQLVGGEFRPASPALDLRSFVKRTRDAVKKDWHHRLGRFWRELHVDWGVVHVQVQQDCLGIYEARRGKLRAGTGKRRGQYKPRKLSGKEQEAWDLYARNGRSISEAAAAGGIKYQTFLDALKRADRKLRAAGEPGILPERLVTRSTQSLATDRFGEGQEEALTDDHRF